MAEKNNAVCSVCGKGYHVCLSCRDSIQLTPYKKLCCSSDCYKVFQIVKGFSTGVYTEDEFKSRLKNLDLSNLENYKEPIKALIKKTLKERRSAKTEEVKSVEAVIAEVEKDVIAEPVVTPRKRNFKAEVE